MSISRLSISLPPEVEVAVRAAAEDAGLSVSAWVAAAAEQAARIQQGRAAVAEYEAEYGRLSDAERHEARRVLADLGVIESLRATG